MKLEKALYLSAIKQFAKSSILKLSVIVLVFRTVLCEDYCPKSAEKPLETRVQDATIVFRAVIVESHYEVTAKLQYDEEDDCLEETPAAKPVGTVASEGDKPADSKTLDLALVSVYRGGSELAVVSPYGGSPYNTTDRQVNLKVRPPLAGCFNWSVPTSSLAQLVVFARISDPSPSLETTPADGPWLEATGAAVPWTLGVDIAIWNSVGWGGWGEWGACSSTCGGGQQMRRRACARAPCEGYGEQSRSCNSFKCEGAVNPLATSARRNFHPSQARWERVPDRPHAYSLRPNSYIWIASSEVFPGDQRFPREFTLFVTLRLRPESGGYGQGTLFSLRSRRRAGAFLSLELAGRGAARLVHAGAGPTRVIYLAVTLHDFRWHRLAISVHDDSTVRAFVDCRWLRTDVLERDSLDTPKDADLIIGYLFSGDLEQLVIVPAANAASQQCSNQEVPVYNDLPDKILDNTIDVT